MKFTLSWLKEYLDTNATLTEISEKLTAIGLEVEEIFDPAAALDGFVVGHVVSAEKHPDADKLKCLVVDTGSEKLNVVCGAPNARAGMKGVFAPVGAYVPGIDLTLKKAKIRGQESNGMMCSARELEISDEHEGIIDLSDDIQTGTPASTALNMNDPVIEINLTPNRGDCAGIYGIARDLAASGLGTLKPLPDTTVKGTFDNPVSVTIADEKKCPMFIGRYIKDVKNGESPDWLKQRLTAIGLRPISVLVDITNYMTIAFNRPLHVFDADKLKGNIHIRDSKKGEEIEALNDQSYTLTDGMTAVCDDNGVLGLGGIIGGVPSSMDENTTNVYLEIALFNPVTTAMTGRALMIDSDARYRFERGIDPAFIDTGANIATQMIIDLCGGEASTYATAGAKPNVAQVVPYNPDKTNKLGGVDIDAKEQKNILTNLGFVVDDAKETWQVTVPSWRTDIDGSADLVEEILRIYGYDNIPVTPVRLPVDEKRHGVDIVTKRGISTRRLLTTRGLYETVTWAFIDDASANLFGANDLDKKSLTLIKPISTDMSVMRPSILPSLIQACGKNTDRGYPNASLFEIGNVYHGVNIDQQFMTATGLRSGLAMTRHWTQKPRDVDAYDTKADVFAILSHCGLNTDNLRITTDAPNWYHPGRSGAIRLGKTVVAYFGEIHPSVLSDMGRDEKYAGFEVFLNNIPVPKNKNKQKPLLKPSAFQPITRDFAFLMDDDVTAIQITQSIQKADKKLITDVNIFDVYKGKGVEPGQKSVAISVTLQPTDKTLTDEEIKAVCDKIVSNIASDTNGTLRG